MNSQVNPIPLIQFNEQKFCITDQAKQFLSSLDQPLGIITIVGKYRTGKSLFLNKVLLKNKPNSQQQSTQSSFKVCPTINSCTKGLWISKQTISSSHPEYDGLKVLVIDSQGFGAMEQSDKYCNNILLLALLLSSYFIYNSVGSIDQKSLNNLNIITNLAKDLQSKNMGNQKLQQQLPSFMWVVRDFTLKIVDGNGIQIQPKQYLQEALQIRKGVSDAVQNKNKIRRMIKHFFKERDCYTLVTPVTNQEKLQKLNMLSDEQFRPQFLQQIETLRNKILRKIKPKKLKNRKLTGPTFLELAQQYSQAINNGSLPNLESTWKHITNFETTRSVNRIKQQILNKKTTFMNEIHTEIQIAAFEKNLLSFSYDKCRALLTHEKQISQNFEKIKQQIEKSIKQIRQINKKNSLKLLQQQFNERNLEYGKQKGQMSISDMGQKLQRQLAYYQSNYQQNPSLSIFLANTFYPIYYSELKSFAKLQIKNIQKQLSLCQQRQKQQQNYLIQAHKKIKQNQHQLQVLKQSSQVQSIKYNQNIKIKNLQYQFLKKQNNQIQGDVKLLLTKLEKLQLQLRQERQNKYDIITKKQVVEGSYRQLQQNRKYLQKQIQILKHTLSSKQQQIQTYKQNITELRYQLQKSQDRQKNTTTKIKAQIQNKSHENQTLVNKFQLTQKQLIAVSQKLVRVQTKLQQQNKSYQNEKNMYEDMIDTLKTNLQNQSRNRDEIIQSNKNMGFALKHLQQRFQHIQQKQKKLKQFKRCIKNSSCLQCINCSKFFVPTIFSQHLNVCMIGSDSLKINQSLKNVQAQDLQIKVLQTLLKDSDSKPYTEYALQITKGKKSWKIDHKYKSLCELHSQLKAQFPGVGLSQNSFIVCPQEATKKSMLVQQRRKILQKYLNDLAKNPLVLHSHIFREFIQDNSQPQLISIQSPSKMAISQLMKSNVLSQLGSPDKENYSMLKNNSKSNYKSPQEFLKIWNQRNIRAKQISKTRALK